MKRILLLSLFSIVFFSFSGCNKSQSEGRVGITVVNNKGIPIQNCNVTLTVPIDPSLNPSIYYGTTDVNGFVEFGSGLHVYYDVTVWKGLWEGCDFVEIKPGEYSNKTVIIYPSGSQFNGCL